ncbi:MAG: histidine--tRNA ligase [Phycisphaerae bacterium]|mgnify:CR=1 FL=1|nr:histidine--tRNA ligase [Phycisphaerae bacterium]
MAATPQKLQSPKGTRDFYPIEMATRRHIEAAWRSASVDCGFEEIDGPTFEHLELYTIKSGEGIVNELFSFTRAGGEATYALRPEFTPTLARMVVAKGQQLPLPLKWFCMPSMFRAERPQRGRLREFQQWNADIVGTGGCEADAEIISVAVLALERLGLTPADVQVRISHRDAMGNVLRRIGVRDEGVAAAFELIDRRDRLPPEEFMKRAEVLGFTPQGTAHFERVARTRLPLSTSVEELADAVQVPIDDLAPLAALRDRLATLSLSAWCSWDLGIVRGLAYYTGAVFEIHEITGAERAIAGGGRYDTLVELFGGPSMPACGFGMGDVVLSLVLADRGLLKPEERLPRPDVFLLSNGSEVAERALPGLLSELRRSGLHARQSYKTTRNIGKLLGDAGKVRARFAAILDEKLIENTVTLKNLDTGEQTEVRLEDLGALCRAGGSRT